MKYRYTIRIYLDGHIVEEFKMNIRSEYGLLEEQRIADYIKKKYNYKEAILVENHNDRVIKVFLYG